MKAKDFREMAKKALSGKWGTAIGTTIVASLLGVFGYPTATTSTEKLTDSDITAITDFFSTDIGLKVLAVLTVLVVIMTIWSIIRFIIGGALKLGYSDFTVKIIDGQDAKFADLFGKMGMFGKGLLLQLLTDLYTFLWTLLFIIPGIMKAYSYSMARFILAENPELSSNEAITASKNLMKGNRWRLFCLEFSYIGWDILTVLTLGILDLYVQPYKQVAIAGFYRVIVAEKEEELAREKAQNA